MHACAFAHVEIPGDEDGQEREARENVERLGDAAERCVRPAEDFRHEERAIGADGRREARDERCLELVIENVRNHAERGARDKARHEEQHEERRKEQAEAVALYTDEHED